MEHFTHLFRLLRDLISIIFVLGFLAHGCTDSKYKFRQTGQVTEYYYRTDSIVHSSRVLLKGRSIFPVSIGQSVKDFEHFVYKDFEPEEGFWFMFGFFNGSFDSVHYMGEICYLVGNKTYHYVNDTVTIYKYDYDIPNCVDEEHYIYVNPELGLIGIFYYSWIEFTYYRDDDIPDELENMIWNDINEDQYSFLKPPVNSRVSAFSLEK